MEGEDRWAKLESIIRRVIGEELDRRDLKTKTKIGFVNGQWIGITTEQLSSWKIAYECDVDQELKKAAAWLTSNKQPKNFARFLNAWLSRTHERSLIRSIPTRSEAVKIKPCAYCGQPSNGRVVGGIYHCADHVREAMDGEPRAA